MEVKKDQQLKDYQKGRYTWRIENFTHLKVSKLYSGIFVINDHRWRLLVYPKGNGVEYLSVYLDVPDSVSLPKGWSIMAQFSVALINHMDSKNTVKKETEHEFNSSENDWGFTSFFPLSKLHAKNGGFLVNETCTIDVEVSVTQTSPVSTHKPSNDSSAQNGSKPIDFDDAESTYIKAESFLKSISKKSTSSVPAATSAVPPNQDYASLAKVLFDKLIALPLYDLVDLKNETAMIESLSILGDHLSLFSDEHAKQILSLKASFPTTVQEWRDSVQVKDSCEHFLSIFNKTKNLLEDSVKTEKGIKMELEELNNKERELEMQLEALRNKSRRLREERKEISEQTGRLYALAEEQAGKIEGKEQEMDLANKKLEDLKSNWASVKSLFT